MTENLDSRAMQYARNLTAEAYPRASDLPGIPVLRRKWVLRVKADLPHGAGVETAAWSFESSARQTVGSTLGITGKVERPLFAVAGVRLDDHHLVLEVDCPSSEAELGDVAAIVTSVTLRAADRLWQIEDIQGIPKEHWCMMR